MKLGEKVKRTDFITEVFKVYPQVMDLYVNKSMHCIGCEVQDFETIEDSCTHHNMDIDSFVAEINDIVAE